MELILQFGDKMMEHCRALASDWNRGCVILSPRDLSEERLPRFSEEFLALNNTSVMLDPQFFLPHADHERLTSHSYWPQDYNTAGFWSGDAVRRLLRSLLKLNSAIRSRFFILPGLFADRVDDDWLACQSRIVSEANTLETTRPMLATVALSADALRSDDDKFRLLDAASTWDVSGIYLVCEHPNGDYIVLDESWMANVLDLVAGLRLKGRHVVVGYCNQQMLALSASAATAIASGTWMNVRSFLPEKFRIKEEEFKQRSVWYYCPQTYSEYKIPALDNARRTQLLNDMAPDPALNSRYADGLFAGPQPTSVGFSEQSAFRHFLQCLWSQSASATDVGFDLTFDRHMRLLDASEQLLVRLHEAGIVGQQRDFLSAVEVNRSALRALRATRGAILRREWSTLLGGATNR